MIDRLSARLGVARDRVREVLVALLALGLVYAAIGTQPLLLAAIVIFLFFVWRHSTRTAVQQPVSTAAAPGDGLDYEQTLEVLLGMVGRPVIALLALRAGTPMGVADLQGTLRSAEPDQERYQLLDERYSDREVLFFAIESSGFWLPRDDFVSAQLVEQEGQVGIELIVGDLRIGVFDDQASRLSDILVERSA